MHTFNVWAPHASRVELVADGRRAQLERGSEGWWSRSDDTARMGTRYGFSLNGGDPRPDPRSGSQPDGVLGLSEVVDHQAHAWSDGGWRGVRLRGSILYELHVGTFTQDGTFDAVVDRLPHLESLGVTAIELMPVAEFSGNRGWGYDGVDLYAPHHAYGGPRGLKRLVDACHSAGLGVLLDVVYNHLGPAGNFLAEFGPYFSKTHQTGWGAALNFDGPGGLEVRRYVIDNALTWLREYHFDGLRLDAVHAILDESAVHLLAQMADEVRALGAQLGRSMILVAESDLNDPRFVLAKDSGGLGLDGVWSDDWHHALHTALTGERTGYYEDYGALSSLEKALGHAWVYDGEWSAHRHRTHGGKTAGIADEQFVVSAQNHDQVGNRAGGERLGALVGESAARAAAALLLTSPFTPMLFQGEEWACDNPFLYFTDHADPALATAVREGRRREFAAFDWSPQGIPDPQDISAFERSKLAWDELEEPDHQRMLSWYRALIGLRARLSAEPPAQVRVKIEEDARNVTFERDPIRVLVNLADVEWRPATAARSRPVTGFEQGIHPTTGHIVIPPHGTLVIEEFDV